MTIPDSGIALDLAPIDLPNPDGERIILGSLWETEPAVLVFLRHYG